MPICPAAANGADTVPRLSAQHADGDFDDYPAYHSGNHTSAPTRPATAATSLARRRSPVFTLTFTFVRRAYGFLRVASPALSPVYSDTYGAVYGELVSRPRTELPLVPDKDGRYRDYETDLAGNAIADTLRTGFEAMAALL